MKVFVPKDSNNYLPNKYTKHALESDLYQDYPVVSFPINIAEIPENTESLALSFIDYDSIPVCGFAWIHWCACNIPVNESIPEDISRFGNIIQGKNSFCTGYEDIDDINIIERYVGPMPPDTTHIYTLTVYALDTKLNMPHGYFLNDFYKKIGKHVLAEGQCEVSVKK